MVTYRPKPKPSFILTGEQTAKLDRLRIAPGDIVTGAADFGPDQHIRQAIGHISEARKHLTIWEFEKFIRDHVRELGGHGFLCSIGEAILRAATIEADPSAKPPEGRY